MCTAKKGKHHVSVSHMGKLKGKEVKNIERWKKELCLLENRTVLFLQFALLLFVCVCIYVYHRYLGNFLLPTGNR